MQDNNDERLDEDIDREFDDLVENSTDDEFWAYVRTWLSVEWICDTMRDWDTETKAQAIEEMKKLWKK